MKPKFTIETYRASEDDDLSVCILSDDDNFEINDAIEFLYDNYKKYEYCELVEENEVSVANYYMYKYCVVFHELKDKVTA